MCELESGKEIEFKIAENRQIYYVQIEGDSKLNTIHVSKSDAVKIKDEKALHVSAISKIHFLFIEMKS